MKKALLNSTFGLLTCGSLIAGPAEDIAKKHAAASAVELETYIKDNPNAEDKADAVDFLLATYDLIENNQRKVVLLKEKFDTLPTGTEIDPQALYLTTGELFSLYTEAGDKEAAKALIEAAQKKSKGHQAEAQLARAFQQMQKQLNLPGVGDTMEIKFTSLQGQEIDLAAMKDKVVLIDFWATWCGPCIAELPHVKETYSKYKDQGFEIIGISLDKEEDKEKLQEFITTKNMAWPQHFDGKGWGNELAKKYGISGIPATFLIGKDGKIVATNLRGTDLEKTVSEHLTK